MLWHTRNENDIIKYLKARKRGSGADGIDQSGIPFEVRESRKVPKFRIQKDVHDYLLQHDGYYIFNEGISRQSPGEYCNNINKKREMEQGSWLRL